MANYSLFYYKLDKLTKIGDFVILPLEFKKQQVANALHAYGRTRGVRLSYVKTDYGYHVTYVGERK